MLKAMAYFAFVASDFLRKVSGRFPLRFFF